MDSEALQQRVLKRTAELAAVSADDIGPDTTLESVGLDSSDAVILAMEVEEMTGREIDVSIFLRCSNLGEAVAEVLSEFAVGDGPNGSASLASGGDQETGVA